MQVRFLPRHPLQQRVLHGLGWCNLKHIRLAISILHALAADFIIIWVKLYSNTGFAFPHASDRSAE